VKNSPPGPALSAGLRRYLYFTAACTGGAIMIVQILGARMLSPFIGTSHFVWTAQIAITLVALAAGYYTGGRLADRSQNLAGLYWAILGAAAYLVVTVLICEPVAYRCLDFNLVAGSLLAATFLFFVPLALLAMTGPFLVRVMTSSVIGLGGNIGRLSAIGTLGSFAGTVLISYVMLPLLANPTSMYLTALGLVLLAGGYFLAFNRRAVTAPAALLAVLGLGAGIAALANRAPARPHAQVIERFSGNSHFGALQVFDWPQGSFRLLANDNLIQNTYDPGRKQSASAFTYLLAGLARAYTAEINDVLCIGLGVGIVPMDFVREGVRVDVVEINPKIVPLAVEFFDLEPEKLGLTINDGRHFLNRSTPARYDVVVLDAFLGDSSPSHLMTREAFASIRRVLRPGGTLVINAFCHLEPGRDYFTTALHATLSTVFPGVRLHASGGQVYFVATDRADPEFLHAPDLTPVHPQLRAAVQEAYAARATITSTPDQVLTDDFNPAEFYDAANRVEARRQMVMGARNW
jgi:spermidine synthase